MLIRIIAGSVAGAITMYLSGFLIFGLLLADYVKANTHQYAGLVKDPPEHVSLFLFNLVWAALLTIIFVKWAGIKSFISGMGAGALIFFLMNLGIDLSFNAFMNLFTGFAPMAVDVLASTFLGALSGGVIGFVLGKFESEAAGE